MTHRNDLGTTGDDIAILDAMIRENACHHWCGGDSHNGLKADNARRMRAAFAPKTHSFQSQALIRGVVVLQQAVDALAT